MGCSCMPPAASDKTPAVAYSAGSMSGCAMHVHPAAKPIWHVHYLHVLLSNASYATAAFTAGSTAHRTVHYSLPTPRRHPRRHQQEQERSARLRRMLAITEEALAHSRAISSRPPNSLASSQSFSSFPSLATSSAHAAISAPLRRSFSQLHPLPEGLQQQEEEGGGPSSSSSHVRRCISCGSGYVGAALPPPQLQIPGADVATVSDGPGSSGSSPRRVRKQASISRFGSSPDLRAVGEGSPAGEDAGGAVAVAAGGSRPLMPKMPTPFQRWPSGMESLTPMLLAMSMRLRSTAGTPGGLPKLCAVLLRRLPLMPALQHAVHTGA